MHPADHKPPLPPQPDDAPERRAAANEPLLGYLAVVARNLMGGDSARLEGASDRVQWTGVAALDNIARGRGAGPADGERKAWLRGIMLNVRREGWRRREPSGDLARDPIAADTRSPSRKATREELLRRLAQARSRLDERDRQVLDWRYQDQLTFDAIGTRLGVSAVAAHKAHQRALARLERSFNSP